MYGMNKAVRMLSLQNQVYQNEIRQPSPHASLKNELINIPLYPHQGAVVERMKDLEVNLSKGYDISGQKLYSTYAILGDNVGVGKSLMVLSHIANLKQSSYVLQTIPRLSQPNSRYFFSIEQSQPVYDISQACPILVVPHSLFRQWSNYIKLQTKLKPLSLAMKKQLEKDLLKNIFTHDFILISNTLLPYFQEKIPPHIYFQRVFIDEADTIKLSKMPYLKTLFTWFISASWPNLLFLNEYLSVVSAGLQHYVNTSSLHPELKEQYNRPIGNNSIYSTQYFRVNSYTYLKEMLELNHPLRSSLVIRCSRDFVRESILLPPLYRTNILCLPSITQQIVSGVVSSDIQNLLHGGDIQSALQLLGVRDEQPLTLIQAVTENRMKELDRLKKTYEFKAGLEYHTPQAKEQALALLQAKIQHLEEQIKTIRERIENFEKEICPICFDEPQSAILTACCNRIFCAACMLNSLARNPACPLCRANTSPSQLRKITTEQVNRIVQPEEEKEEKPLKKKEMLLKILRDNPKGKFLIFSKYDNPFEEIEAELQTMKVKVRQVKGNKDSIQLTLDSFAKGETQCLLLNATYAGAGLNITAATHVILLHAMSIEEEKQILGRAYRLGRKEPLTMLRLLHPDEIQSS